ncbi:MAG TPA: tetratricopeptide repeat protein, partial [Candidatus Eisenbacteria bacterium]|nr:tetratricopeptide repeat protein [Candidatus Eisenbacteria bacterium]
ATLFPDRGRPRRKGTEPGSEPLSVAERQAQHKSRQRILEAMAREAGYRSPADLAAALLSEPANRHRAREVRALANRPDLLTAIQEDRVAARDIEEAANDVLRAAYRKWSLPPPGRLGPEHPSSSAFTPLGPLPRGLELPAGPQAMLVVQALDEAGDPLAGQAEPPDFEYLVRLGAGRAGSRLVLGRDQAGGYLLAFATVERAVSAARAMRADLSAPSSPMPFRMAVHVGPLLGSLGGYPSRDVHVADALLLLAGRDRILLTGAAAGRLDGTEGVRSWGVRVLPILQLEEVHELEDATAPPPHQVPLTGMFERLPSLPFVALADLVSEGAAAVRSGARLVTFYGPGGAGATRVALQVAVAVAAGFEDGVHGVDLTALVERSQVAKVVADVLGVRTPGLDSVGPLVAHLHSRKALLVLDSCDRALTECQRLLDLLLAHCPSLVVLTTSLEPLSLPRERSFNLRPLSLPRAAAGSVRLVDVDSSEAGRLFVTRAAEVDPGRLFEESEANAVADVCQLVQGLPIAIELVAAMTAFGINRPTDLARDLREYLEQQTGVPGPALPRERLLQLTVSWRFRRLSPELARIVLVLSLFPTDFDAAAGASVCGERAERGAPAFEQTLAELVWQGFVRSIGEASAAAPARFRIPESIRLECDALRRYQESLVAEVEAARMRFADHFAALLTGAVGDVHGPEQRRRIERLRREIPNFRAALLWSRPHPERTATWARLAGSYAWFLLQIGRTEEAERIVLDGLDRWAAADATRHALLSHAGFVAWRRGDLARAEQMWTEAAAVAGDEDSRSRALDQLGMVALSRGDHEAAAARCREGLAIARRIGSAHRIAFCLFHLGLLALRSGDPAEARRQLEESLELRLRASPANPARAAASRLGLAELAISEGELAGAREHLREALRTYVERQHRAGLAAALCMCGVLAAAEPDADCAVRLFAAADRILADMGQQVPAIWQPTVERAAESARTRLSARHVQLAAEFGGAMDDHEAVAYAEERLDAPLRSGSWI